MKWLAGTAVLLVTLLVSGCLTPLTGEPSPSASAPASAPASSAPSPPLTPVPTPGSPLVGVYEPGSPASWSGVSGFASATGIKPQIALYYSSWTDEFAASFAETARRHGAYVLVQLEPKNVPLSSIVAGRSDAYLRAYARAVRSFGYPVLLSFGHEMNGTWYSWGAGHVSPATYVAAWRHVVSIFREQKATNVTWVWAVNATNVGANSLRQWWPGSAWVNWVGMDGYYYSSSDTFSTVFGGTIAQIRTFSSAPLLIAETAVGVTPNRESQITMLIAGVRAEHLAGLVWFDEAQHAGVYHQNWRLEDDPAALAAFTAAVRRYLG